VALLGRPAASRFLLPRVPGFAPSALLKRGSNPIESSTTLS